MTAGKHTSMKGKQRQRGFSLIELLVALSINLVIVVAAAYLYLGTSDAKRALDQQQTINENGQYALDLIGRDIINAGFYPSYLSIGATARKTYSIDTATLIATAYASGVYGCETQSFNGTTKTCATHSSASVTADTIVVNYFTTDALGNDIGQRLDCTRGNVSSASENSGRTNVASGVTSGPLPSLPLFVSNRYTLLPSTVTVEGVTINTQSLACSGNQGITYQPVIQGIEALQFRYGVTKQVTLEPDSYYNADQMAGLGTVAIDGVLKDAWARVVSVEVCMVARGLQATKTAKDDGTVTPYVNCAGTTVTPTDKFVRRVYRKIFALRNNLTQTILPAS